MRALYDYEAAESDELDFKAGNYIVQNKDKSSFKIEHNNTLLHSSEMTDLYLMN